MFLVFIYRGCEGRKFRGRGRGRSFFYLSIFRVIGEVRSRVKGKRRFGVK